MDFKLCLHHFLQIGLPLNELLCHTKLWPCLIKSQNFHVSPFNDIRQYVFCAAAVDEFNLASVDVYLHTAIHPTFKTQNYSPCINELCH